MTNDSKNAAQQLATEIFARTLSAWNAVHTFRWIGQLGLPYAAKHAAWQHQRTTQQFATADEYKDMFMPGGRETLVELGFFETAAKAMTLNAMSIFNSVSDASSLIFAHSVLDGAALDWCRVCAIAEPDDLMPCIDKKRVALSKVKTSSFIELRDDEIKTFFASLERESLIKKLDTIFGLCRPPINFMPMNQYNYDRQRIIDLDNLRHDYVHRTIKDVRLPRGVDDLWYLFNTTYFLLSLVHYRYGIKLDPNRFITGIEPLFKEDSGQSRDAPEPDVTTPRP
jgi:hypothetical protein